MGSPNLFYFRSTVEGLSPDNLALWPWSHVRENKTNSFQIFLLSTAPTFFQFHLLPFLFHGHFLYDYVPNTAKGQYDRTSGTSPFCLLGEMLGKRASSNGCHYHIHIKIYLRFLSIGGIMYTHCKLFYKICLSLYSVMLLAWPFKNKNSVIHSTALYSSI